MSLAMDYSICSQPSTTQMPLVSMVWIGIQSCQANLWKTGAITKTLLGMARHYKTGEVLPEEYYQKLVDSKNYMAATGTLRQLHFVTYLDMHLHHDFDPHGSKTVFDLQKEIANDVLVSPTHAKDRFLCSFSHIFAGGYSAGYYSYKWAEVLSSDAFSAFEEIDLDDANAVKEVGQKFRDTVLSLGGSIPYGSFQTI